MPEYRVHVFQNTGSTTGHSFIELRAGGKSTYYELNTNPAWTGPSTWMLGVNPYNPTDGIVNKTVDITNFTSTATRQISNL